jgi:hypothetical protein
MCGGGFERKRKDLRTVVKISPYLPLSIVFFFPNWHEESNITKKKKKNKQDFAAVL